MFCCVSRQDPTSTALQKHLNDPTGAGVGSQSHLGQSSQDFSTCAAGIRCPAFHLFDVGTFLATLTFGMHQTGWFGGFVNCATSVCFGYHIGPAECWCEKICLQRFSCREKSFRCPKDMYPYWHQEKRGLDFEGMMAGIEKMKESLLWMSGIDVGADHDWYAWVLPMAMGIHPKMFPFGSREPAKKNWNCVSGGRVHPTPCCSNAKRIATTSFHGRTKAKWESFFANEVQGSCSQSHWCWSNSGSMAEDCCSLQRKNLGKQGLFTLHLFYGCLAVTSTWLFFSAVLKLRKAHSIVGQCLPGLCKWPVGKGWLLPEAESWLQMITSQFQTPFDPRTNDKEPKNAGQNGGLPKVAWSSSLQLGLICTVSICFTSLEPPLTG